MSLLPVQVNNPRAQRDRLDAARSRVQKARDKRAQAQRAFQEAKEADDRDAQRIAAADLDEAHGEIERAQELQSRALSQIGEAVASEWQGPLDAGAALAYYEQIVAVVDGKVAAAKGVGELNAALSTVIAGIWMEVAGGTLQAEFQLRPPSGLAMVSGLAEALAVDAAGRRIALPQGVEEPSEVEMVQASLASKLDHTPSSTAPRVGGRGPPPLPARSSDASPRGGGAATLCANASSGTPTSESPRFTCKG